MKTVDWFVVCKTGQIVHDFTMPATGNKPDLSLYYEFPDEYDAILNPSELQLEAYRKARWRSGPSAVGI